LNIPSLARHLRILSTLSLLLLLPLSASAQENQLTGRLDVIWGDPVPDSGLDSHLVLTLTDNAGRVTELSISDELRRRHGGFLSWNGRRVRIDLRQSEDFELAATLRPGTRQVAALTLLDDPDTLGGGVSGAQPWVSILCKFSDKPAEPENLAFFQGMYANVSGGLDHYWREQSYDIINVVGSTAIDWVDLPNPQSFYIPTPGSNFDSDLDALFDDCTAAADPFIDFSNGGSPYVGINQMFNDLLDCCAWGGGKFATLDGVSKVWRTTWEPPWAYANEGVIGHEMGHGFGLPHANNWDEDGNPYDSPWDVMSSATGYSVDDPTYGRLGKHVVAFHKDTLGWFAPAERLEVPVDTSVTATIDAMALASTSNYRMAKIPISGGSTYYTVEVRDFLGYDGNVPGNAVILHLVDPGRSEPAWAVDTDVPPADYSDNEGTMFRVGETFTDMANSITIEVNMATMDGFEVTITSGTPTMIFADGFESNDTTAWSAAVP
jgi:hypothetical protein